MSYVIVGHCPKCGAPIHSPAVWHAVTPPPSYPSCDCNPSRTRVVASDNTSMGPYLDPSCPPDLDVS